MLTYSIAHPLACSELERLKQLAEEFPKTIVSVLCEDLATIDALGPSIGVFIDVNSGMNRSGMPLEDEQDHIFNREKERRSLSRHPFLRRPYSQRRSFYAPQACI